MWRKYEGIETVGFVRMINEDYGTWTENAEVILLDTFHDGSKLLTRRIVKFTEYVGSDKKEDINELREDFSMHYGKVPVDLTDLAFYCADGWSRSSADERIENPSDAELHNYLKKHGIE